jgi:HK97 family phage major capsid protein
MLTDEQKKELDKDIEDIVNERVQKQVEEELAKQIVKRFTPVEITSSPEDRILADTRGGFKNAAHFIAELIEEGRTHQAPETLKAWDNAVRTKDMEEGSLSAGGYLVYEEMSRSILEKSLEDSIVRPRASMQPMQSNRIVIPADVDANHQSNYFGGITIYRPGEAGQKTATNPTYARIALTLHKVTGLCHISDELLEDSAIAVEANVRRKFSQAIAFVQDDDFLNGNGVNAPLGVLNSNNPSLITVTAETGQGASTIVAENIIKMWARMYSAGKARSIWIANDDTFPQLATMALAVGTGGVPLWMPAGGVSGLPYQTLMGKPLIFTEKAQTIGTAGDIALVDLSQYLIGEKGGLQVATSMHFKFDYDQQSFRFVLRYDGQPSWTSALTPLRSSSTLSPFIVLHSTRT